MKLEKLIEISTKTALPLSLFECDGWNVFKFESLFTLNLNEATNLILNIIAEIEDTNNIMIAPAITQYVILRLIDEESI